MRVMTGFNRLIGRLWTSMNSLEVMLWSLLCKSRRVFHLENGDQKSLCISCPSCEPFCLSLRALKLCGSGGPPHVKLIIEWEPRVKDWSVYLPLHCTSVNSCCFWFVAHYFWKKNFPSCGIPACSVTFMRKWLRMQTAYEICSSSTSNSSAAPWMSASSSTPKRNRYCVIVFQRHLSICVLILSQLGNLSWLCCFPS